MGSIRALIVGDHLVFSAGLRLLVDSQPDVEVVGEAASADAAARASACLPDVVVMALMSDAANPTDAIAGIYRTCPSTRILAMGVHSDIECVRAVLAAGAHGFLGPQAAEADLWAAIRALHGGATFIDARLAGSLLRPAPSEPPDFSGDHDLVDRLSQRERQVLQLLVQGYTNQQIADQLFLSVKTTETYRARLQRKLSLRDRAGLVRFGLERGLLALARSA